MGGHVAASKGGWDAELAQFCSDAHPRLVGALVHQLGDPWLAEEVAQEALIRVCSRWGQLRDYRDPTGWAFRVAVNLSRSQLRRRRAELRARARHGAPPSSHTDPDAADRLVVRTALTALPDRQRELIVLRYFLRCSVEETASLTGATPGAVRTATHRAITALRAMLDVEETADGR
jgi:RNA polymerase sigma-70 factor (sigma-E family)